MLKAPRLIGIALLLVLPGALGPTSVRAEECANCFAVFVMPDTQDYTHKTKNPDDQGKKHLDLVTRYICDNKTTWTEPSTNKVMPIAMVIQLGDLVQSGDARPDEWKIVDGAFDTLDDCGVPYLVTTGNHDYAANMYQARTKLFNSHFGVDRWANHQCADPSNCRASLGEWFIGGGTQIAAYSRGHIRPRCRYPAPPHLCKKPARSQPGRHRVGVIRMPNGQRFLFLGLEMAFDFPIDGKPAHPGNGDDLAWVNEVLRDYSEVPTVLFHHSLFYRRNSGRLAFGADFPSDTITNNQKIWDALIEPNPQIFMTFNGHFLGLENWRREAYQERARSNPGRPPVHALFANYQTKGRSCGLSQGYGGGWNVIVAFDPDAGEIRPRSYRIVGDGATECDGNPRSIGPGPEDEHLLDFNDPSPDPVFPVIDWDFGSGGS